MTRKKKATVKILEFEHHVWEIRLRNGSYRILLVTRALPHEPDEMELGDLLEFVLANALRMTGYPHPLYLDHADVCYLEVTTHPAGRDAGE